MELNFILDSVGARWAPMTGEGKGKVVDRGKKYRKIFIYIPKEVSSDTSFPFKIGEDVTVRIDGERLIIEKRKTPAAK